MNLCRRNLWLFIITASESLCKKRRKKQGFEILRNFLQGFEWRRGASRRRNSQNVISRSWVTKRCFCKLNCGEERRRRNGVGIDFYSLLLLGDLIAVFVELYFDFLISKLYIFKREFFFLVMIKKMKNIENYFYIIIKTQTEFFLILLKKISADWNFRWQDFYSWKK